MSRCQDKNWKIKCQNSFHFSDVIQSPTDVKTDFLSAHEFYASDRITVLPGAIYPDHNIRIRRIEKFDNGFASLEPCCGTHVNSTAELECFTITSFKNNKLGTFDITAVCGPTARQVTDGFSFPSSDPFFQISFLLIVYRKRKQSNITCQPHRIENSWKKCVRK